jgi:hypothetical protein
VPCLAELRGLLSCGVKLSSSILGRNQQIFSCEGQRVNILEVVAQTVSVTATQLTSVLLRKQP